MFVFSPSVNMTMLPMWLMERKWTPELIVEWQTFYNNASRFLIYGQSGNFSFEYLPHLPTYKDLKPAECKTRALSFATRQTSSFLLPFILLCVIVSKIFS